MARSGGLRLLPQEYLPIEHAEHACVICNVEAATATFSLDTPTGPKPLQAAASNYSGVQPLSVSA